MLFQVSSTQAGGFLGFSSVVVVNFVSLLLIMLSYYPLLLLTIGCHISLSNVDYVDNISSSVFAFVGYTRKKQLYF